MKFTGKVFTGTGEHMTGPVSIVGVWSALASIQPLSDPAGSWTPYAPMSDEFDGTELNSSKWSTDYTQWAGRQPGLFDASNVNVRHGSLTLLAQSGHRNSSWPVGYDNYSTSALHSVDKTLHGYFEVRSRSGSSSISSSWWFHWNDGAGTWTEIDVFESEGSDAPQASSHNATMFCSHTHIFALAGVPQDELPAKCGCMPDPPRDIGRTRGRYKDNRACSLGGCMGISFAIDQGFHVYGLEWNQSAVGFYIDGAPVGKLPAACLTAPIGMDFDRETMPDWMGLPDPATLPDVPFEIDYVRAWKSGR